ncbi:MAG: hypothetical protein JNL32_00130 [Candidatus Kapabacteria bacterium]|nr:hypothetical protein [Candidatus Kapabacteria bacterium]
MIRNASSLRDALRNGSQTGCDSKGRFITRAGGATGRNPIRWGTNDDGSASDPNRRVRFKSNTADGPVYEIFERSGGRITRYLSSPCKTCSDNNTTTRTITKTDETTEETLPPAPPPPTASGTSVEITADDTEQYQEQETWSPPIYDWDNPFPCPQDNVTCQERYDSWTDSLQGQPACGVNNKRYWSRIAQYCFPRRWDVAWWYEVLNGTRRRRTLVDLVNEYVLQNHEQREMCGTLPVRRAKEQTIVIERCKATHVNLYVPFLDTWELGNGIGIRISQNANVSLRYVRPARTNESLCPMDELRTAMGNMFLKNNPSVLPLAFEQPTGLNMYHVPVNFADVFEQDRNSGNYDKLNRINTETGYDWLGEYDKHSALGYNRFMGVTGNGRDMTFRFQYSKQALAETRTFLDQEQRIDSTNNCNHLLGASLPVEQLAVNAIITTTLEPGTYFFALYLDDLFGYTWNSTTQSAEGGYGARCALSCVKVVVLPCRTSTGKKKCCCNTEKTYDNWYLRPAKQTDADVPVTVLRKRWNCKETVRVRPDCT